MIYSTTNITPNALINGDCLEVMKSIPDKSIDAIICDLPYAVTQNKKDIELDKGILWSHYERIIKDNGAIVLFGQDKFTARMMLYKEKLHRYNLIWKKGERTSGFLNANRMPLRNHEDIMVFYKKLPTYNPQMTIGQPLHGKGTSYLEKDCTNNNYGEFEQLEDYRKGSTQKFPKSIIDFDRPHPPIHPTQKPVDLLEWLIKTYTNENEVVLDNTMGVGTCPIACARTNRKFIGIELDETYYKIACERVNNYENETK